MISREWSKAKAGVSPHLKNLGVMNRLKGRATKCKAKLPFAKHIALGRLKNGKMYKLASWKTDEAKKFTEKEAMPGLAYSMQHSEPTRL